MIYSLLDGNNNNNSDNWYMWVIMGVLVLVLIGSMFLMNRRSKKREQEAQKLIDAVKPGNKVKTIGGICGIVVEVNAEEDTFVLETGSESSGKSYVKFVRQAILESDAVIEAAAPVQAPSEEQPSPDVFDKGGETVNEVAETPAEGEEAQEDKTEE